MADKLRIGINGFGRIGRMVFRAARSRDDLEVVAVNDLLPIDHLAYLLKYDSVHGAFPGTVETADGALVVDGRTVLAFAEKDPAALPWAKADVDLVIESTGRFLTLDSTEGHIKAGAKKVVISGPPTDNTPVFVMGVNAAAYAGETIVSNASCTTNCVAPLAKLINDLYGLEEALMLTVHAVTASQNPVDGVARKDWRFGRGILNNIIPATTGAARMVGKVIPELSGRINGMAVRVPVADVSMVDLTCRFRTKVSYDEISKAIRDASAGAYRGILQWCDDPVVSTDLRGNPHSAIFDVAAGMQTSEGLTKLIAWYDNEWGYANRCLDLAAHMMK
ncbi:type I glyceraldehyde-3-phosphate dehydrogenase [Pleomorphomonas diazotrophica]|uniref:NAD-dependent glyceraldehyde-3-phosphate dehydrogenase n=1 Tax=Pleomorphomonas diazotrophica TaxID=1166257 RepID=A0A1I4V258_9HYPH|nr:type I glyceraldehyde-3-phosphate dehydrogenase [Pleomorphomonas diazotrophica]PKR88701.1 type I glyceraldehyde-3-phosphate dehydrogenase [Pleomorphomonas diazotrophica]SFM95327.1 glyceraldehyde-3-phosphate dehydrogenase (NAD+) [Pleomorphomonas diazotrophica]